MEGEREETNSLGMKRSRVLELMAEIAYECHHYVMKPRLLPQQSLPPPSSCAPPVFFDERPSEEEEEEKKNCPAKASSFRQGR